MVALPNQQVAPQMVVSALVYRCDCCQGQDFLKIQVHVQKSQPCQQQVIYPTGLSPSSPSLPASSQQQGSAHNPSLILWSVTLSLH